MRQYVVRCEIPGDVTIPKGYLENQLRRWVRDYISGRKTLIGAVRVKISRSKSNGRSHSAGLLTIGITGSRTLSDSILHIHAWVTLRTLERKVLEERGIFVGSFVMSSSYATTRRKFRSRRPFFEDLLAASCGAYKVTEEADEVPLRVLEARIPHGRETRSSRFGRPEQRKLPTFSVIVSGLPPTKSDSMKWMRSLVREIAKRAACLPGVRLRNFTDVHDGAAGESSVNPTKRTVALVFEMRSNGGSPVRSPKDASTVTPDFSAVSGLDAAQRSVLAESVVVQCLHQKQTGLVLLPAKT